MAKTDVMDTRTKPATTTGAVNGTDTAKAAPSKDHADGEGTEKRSRGAIPTMPVAILYKENGKVVAAVHHPVNGTKYSQTGKGVGSAKGALEDSGFVLSTVTLEGPEWLSSKLPAGAELIGYAKIAGFPLPAQD